MKTRYHDSSPRAYGADDDEKTVTIDNDPGSSPNVSASHSDPPPGVCTDSVSRSSESDVGKSGESGASTSSPKSDKEPDNTARMNHGEVPMSDNDTTETELMSDGTTVETAGTKKRKRKESDGYDSKDDLEDESEEEIEEFVPKLEEEEEEVGEMFIILQNLY